MPSRVFGSCRCLKRGVKKKEELVYRSYASHMFLAYKNTT